MKTSILGPGQGTESSRSLEPGRGLDFAGNGGTAAQSWERLLAVMGFNSPPRADPPGPLCHLGAQPAVEQKQKFTPLLTENVVGGRFQAAPFFLPPKGPISPSPEGLTWSRRLGWSLPALCFWSGPIWGLGLGCLQRIPHPHQKPS